MPVAAPGYAAGVIDWVLGLMEAGADLGVRGIAGALMAIVVLMALGNRLTKG